MKAQFVKGFLVIPALNSVNFWPFICTKEGDFVKYVKYWFDLTTARKIILCVKIVVESLERVIRNLEC